MTTSSATEVNSHRQDDNTEWIDKALAEALDELTFKIMSKRKFHRSEEHNRKTSSLPEFSESKIYDIINFYHSYCKLCEQHFYSRSVDDDINSFFQKHLNTSYHRQMRKVELPQDTTPMFTWEVKFRTGRCNICKMSGLNSYILDTKFDALKLMKLHMCVWDKENRETNEKVLRKLALLKQYCGLTIFREKLLKTVNGREVCLLCGLRLPWPRETAVCHLSSDGHYLKFCVFLKKCFNFAPKDVLNGFNLEVVTRSLISRDPPPITNFSECYDGKACTEESNNNENPYPEDKDNFSFSPVHMEQFLGNEENDFLHNNECLLCNTSADSGHMVSEEHRSRARNFDENTLDSQTKYVTYCRNRTKRAHIMDILKDLELGRRREPTPRLPSPIQVKQRGKKNSFHIHYIKKLLKEKLELVNFIFTVTNDLEVFCHVCDMQVATSAEIGHLNSSSHKFQEQQWNELRTKIGDQKFLEPFVKCKNLILCLVCGVVMVPPDLYSHLKKDTHAHRFEWYSHLNVNVPISSAFDFRKDFSSTCTLCNWQMPGKNTFTALKVVLKNVRHHWPCPKLKPTESGLRSEQAAGAEGEKMQDQSSVQNESGPGADSTENEKGESCMVNSLDFKKVEKTVDSLVKIFEQEITKNVLERLDNIKLPSLKKQRRVLGTDVRLTVGTEPTCGCEHPSTCSCLVKPTTKSERNGFKEKHQKIVESESTAQKTEKNATSPEPSNKKEEEETEEDKNDTKTEHEVLVISDLPKSSRTYDVIYTKFSPYGKIRYVFFEGKQTILAFAKRGAAKTAATSPSLFVNNDRVTLTVSTRKARPKSEKLHSLHEALVQMLKEPQKLMDFMMNLIVQAVAASESLVEKKREEMVCSTIIAAVFEHYPQARCYPFGSRLSGLTLNNSDLDVFLDCGGMYDGFKNTTPASERKLVNKVAVLLRKKREITDIVVVDRARVPIVSFLHKPTLMHCDLSFKNGLSIQNTLLIKFMISLDWRVKPLILFLKHWAKLNDFHGPPNFSSYAISMLVIFYLQQLECPILPTIESLQNNYSGYRTTIAGWDCSINMNASDVKKSENKDPLPQLLLGLFKYYAGFNYGLNVISPLTGKLLPRKAFSDSDTSELPMCYKRQILNIPQPLENLVNDKISICIIDPFDLSHVLTKSLTTHCLRIFTHLCQKSEDYLKKGITVVTSPA